MAGADSEIRAQARIRTPALRSIVLQRPAASLHHKHSTPRSAIAATAACRHEPIPSRIPLWSRYVPKSARANTIITIGSGQVDPFVCVSIVYHFCETASSPPMPDTSAQQTSRRSVYVLFCYRLLSFLPRPLVGPPQPLAVSVASRSRHTDAHMGRVTAF